MGIISPLRLAPTRRTLAARRNLRCNIARRFLESVELVLAVEGGGCVYNPSDAGWRDGCGGLGGTLAMTYNWRGIYFVARFRMEHRL